ncbi:MAG: hypothetical protein GXY36_13095 [Chloroflexi bacterium]|nr:hypothetical protein [Chloroflexota bacterium]
MSNSLITDLVDGARRLFRRVLERVELDTDPGPERRKSAFPYRATEHTSLTTIEAVRSLQSPEYAFPEKARGGGGGVLITDGKWITDGGGAGSGAGEQSELREVGLGSGNGRFNVGYVLLHLGPLRVYPLAGIGGAGGGLGVNDLKEDSRFSAAWAALVLNAGIGLDLSLKVWRLRWSVGLQAGMNVNVFSVQRGLEREFRPPGGPYFRLLVGPKLFF